MKIQVSERQNVFAIHVSNRRIIFRKKKIYIKYINQKKKNSQASNILMPKMDKGYYKKIKL